MITTCLKRIKKDAFFKIVLAVSLKAYKLEKETRTDDTIFPIQQEL